MPSHSTEPSTLTPTGIGLETIKTATDPMPVPISRAIRNTTVSVAQIATKMDIPIPANWPSTPDETWPMPSDNQPNGATKTVMATAVTPREPTR